MLRFLGHEPGTVYLCLFRSSLLSLSGLLQLSCTSFITFISRYLVLFDTLTNNIYSKNCITCFF